MTEGARRSPRLNKGNRATALQREAKAVEKMALETNSNNRDEKTVRRRKEHQAPPLQTTAVGNKNETGGNFVVYYATGFAKLFFSSRFIKHRVIGLAFLLQYAAAVYLYITDYDRYLTSFLVWTVPLTGLSQSINAALTFTFLPKKEDPGFAAVSDKAVLSYFTVVENSFYAMQLLFACCYLNDDIRPLIKRTAIIEPLMVFFIFYLRGLWPSSRITASLKNDKNKTDENRTMLAASAYAIKLFYLFAKHFVGAFPLYLQFLDRVTDRDRYLLYGIQTLSAYASTISIFIHTLKFKRYIGPTTAMIAYDIIIPGYALLFFNLWKEELLQRNMDVVILTATGMVLNLAPFVFGLRPWFVWQAFVAYLFYTGYPIATIPAMVDLRLYTALCVAFAAACFRRG